MSNPSSEVFIVNAGFIVFWILVLTIILLIGQRSKRTRAFRERMMAQWKPALAITVIYAISYTVSGRGYISPSTPLIFCQALIGLAIARGIAGSEPLRMTRSILRREHVARNLILFVIVSVGAGIAALLIGTVGMSIARSVFHEISRTEEAAQSLSVDKLQALFLFLWGAGIAEETMYRLTTLSFLWALTGRHWFAVIVSAILFGMYHLSPLNGMYLKWWEFPVSQFLSSVFIGIIWGWVFIKRGYESAVMAHTMSNWITVLLFT